MVIKNITDVGVYVKDLSVYMVNTADDMDKLMTMGNKNRSIGATQMNAHSSRSHAIFSITIECSGNYGQKWHLGINKPNFYHLTYFLLIELENRQKLSFTT